MLFFKSITQYSAIPLRANEQFFLVQEFVDGQNLQQELNDKKYLTDSATMDILQDILGVLKFVHLNHYIHRDIKPSNLIRNKSDR